MWTNPWILGGLALVVVPLVIHLVMRSRPRRMMFPALRFVMQSHNASAGMLRLKHIALMLLRMGVLALIVLILARPREQTRTAVAAEGVPAAVVICLDNSPSMQYREMGLARLDAAREMAERIIEKLPPGSRVAVVDLDTPPGAVSLRAVGATTVDEVRAVQGTNLCRGVAAMLRTAEGLLETAGEDRREIYLFTDMTRTAWTDLQPGAFARQARTPVYVVDLGPSDNQNVALEPLRLSSRSVSRGGTISIAAEVRGGEPSTPRSVGLSIGGTMRGRGETSARNPVVTFDQTFADEGVAQGSVSLLEGDPLAADNVRYFTVQVGEPASVAVIRGGEPPAAAATLDAARLVALALEPAGLARRGSSPVQATVVGVETLTAAQLKTFEAVFLADAAGIPLSGWQALEKFVATGGGLVVLLGENVAAEIARGDSTYTSPVARDLLGVAVAGPVDAPAGASLTAATYDVPALAAFDGGRNGDLKIPLIYRWMQMTPAGGARTVLTVGKGQPPAPALVVNPHGGGTSYVLATAPQRQWSNLAGEAEFVILMHSLLGAARHEFAESRGYQIGEPITFSFPRSLGGQAAILEGPGLGGPIERTINATTSTAAFPALDAPGNYRITAGQGDSTQTFGFSLNVDVRESRFDRADAKTVAAFFAPDALHIAESPEELQSARTLATRGRERTALLLPILMAALVVELLLANRFYRRAAAVPEAR